MRQKPLSRTGASGGLCGGHHDSAEAQQFEEGGRLLVELTQLSFGPRQIHTAGIEGGGKDKNINWRNLQTEPGRNNSDQTRSLLRHDHRDQTEPVTRNNTKTGCEDFNLGPKHEALQ